MLRILLSIFFCAQLINPAYAYVRTMSEGGSPLFWAGAPSFLVNVNPRNSSGLDQNVVQQQMQGALQSWRNAGSSMTYSYSQSAGNPLSSGFDGSNSVYFSSASGRPLDYGVIAVTEVLYYVSSGQIAEFDMIYNDNQFLFTNVEGDTGRNSGGRTKIYLQDVATHEFGHALGFDHTNVGRSSLVYTAFSGQFVLGEDDISAIRTVYPASGGRGAIRGTIRGTNGGIFGAHVLAINMNTGKVEAGTLASPDGSFRIGDIPAGSYAVMVEPFGTDISSVSSYYQNVNHRFCSFSRFRRAFYSACGSSQATTVGVNSGGTTEIGTVSPSCNQMGNPGGTSNSIANAKNINSNGGSQFGTINFGDSHYYRVRNVSGSISVKAASYSLYSPADVRVEILQANGNSIGGSSSIDNVENPMRGGYVNYDSSASATNLPAGDYLIRVTAASSRIATTNFPAGFDLVDSNNHYLLMVGVNGEFGTPATSDMSACVNVNNVSQGASYRPPANGGDDITEGGGCGGGTLMDGSGGSNGPGNPLNTSIGLILAAAFLSKLLEHFFARKLAGK